MKRGELDAQRFGTKGCADRLVLSIVTAWCDVEAM